MRAKLAFPGLVRAPAAPRVSGRTCASSLACLAFVLFLATAFWAGVVWVGASLLTLFAGAV
jgi:hypothetical protein